MPDYTIDPIVLEYLERKAGELEAITRTVEQARATIRSAEVDVMVIAAGIKKEIEHIMRKAE